MEAIFTRSSLPQMSSDVKIEDAVALPVDTDTGRPLRTDKEGRHRYFTKKEDTKEKENAQRTTNTHQKPASQDLRSSSFQQKQEIRPNQEIQKEKSAKTNDKRDKERKSQSWWSQLSGILSGKRHVKSAM